ncbi:hypothetical protein DR871_004015 [Flavobacterium petrolei]|uniref:Uncharacterized protein n=1 Tax=Flavobacterium petrolei TaxID=2259594 RepID=A0A482TNK9_9FLAO|nr:hypothetical protein [Flavobacterium petrolei]RYJ53223.1 hypothetical protein DR871_004015 [Flavobacterium petrolei]
MKGYKKISFVLITAISLTFCAMKHELQTEFPQEIQSVFYQKVKKGTESSVINFYIEFKKPLAANIKLEKIYFHNQESLVQEITPKDFKSSFLQSIKKEDLIMDKNPAKEYGNKAPVVHKSKFDLKSNEAVLEYTKNGKTLFYKISNVLEKPLR